MNENDKYIGRMLDNRYEILDVIGEGGMALVYKALDHRLNRYIAVKIMRDEMAADEDFRRRFCAESQAVAMLSHPNIVAVYDVSHSDELEYIVMELINGITLKQYMDRRGLLGWKETAHFSAQIARALAHAHERGIIHRDIKPQNIMLLRDGTIKVADFGIAALENELQENDGQTVGSIHYIAPEQARGELPDARSDIYSLGVVMYEMMTGRIPYTGDTLGEIAVKQMNAVPTPIREINPELPEELERIIGKAMSPKLDVRYQSATELAEDLEALSKAGAEPKEENEETAEVSVPDVTPVRSVSELPKEKYARRRRRASRVSFLSGAFLLILLAIWIFSFLWKYWIEDIFAPVERIVMPSFIDMDADVLENDPDLTSRFNFIVECDYDPDSGKRIVVEQDPEPGRSVMVVPSGIVVRLKARVSDELVRVPDLSNRNYIDALHELERLGLRGEVENVQSSSVMNDYVIATSPAAGEKLSPGSVVYVQVSIGPEIRYVEMPNLIGLSLSAAQEKLESAKLFLDETSTEYVASNQDSGTVVGQNPAAFTQCEEHSRVTLQISLGQQG
ncbi:MAG: Stk1 family PASTA domain-containing Ser/Thr kinase [Oscillospiraceae bacterium]|nr:Stk1 family PASTA domain-containing Ser/Thr kinase [Oscillospiraceae bacterium]